MVKNKEDFKTAVKEYEQGTRFDKEIRNALINGTPLPEHHGRLIVADWVKNTLDLYTLNFDGIYKQFIRRSDIDTVPTIIEESDSE